MGIVSLLHGNNLSNLKSFSIPVCKAYMPNTPGLLPATPTSAAQWGHTILKPMLPATPIGYHVSSHGITGSLGSLIHRTPGDLIQAARLGPRHRALPSQDYGLDPHPHGSPIARRAREWWEHCFSHSWKTGCLVQGVVRTWRLRRHAFLGSMQLVW